MWSKTVTNMWGVICPLDECQKCKDGKLSNSNLIIQDQGESGDIVLHFCLSLFSYRRETRERSCKFKMLNQSSCDQCPKTFASTSGLFYHTKGHTGEKKHKCEKSVLWRVICALTLGKNCKSADNAIIQPTMFPIFDFTLWFTLEKSPINVINVNFLLQI